VFVAIIFEYPGLFFLVFMVVTFSYLAFKFPSGFIYIINIIRMLFVDIWGWEGGVSDIKYQLSPLFY